MAEFIQIGLGAGPDHRNQLKYSELKASDVSPERPKGTGQAEPAAAGGKTRYTNHGAAEGARRGLWALGEQAAGLFLRGRRSSFED